MAAVHHDAFFTVDMLLLLGVHNMLFLEALKGKCPLLLASILANKLNQLNPVKKAIMKILCLSCTK